MIRNIVIIDDSETKAECVRGVLESIIDIHICGQRSTVNTGIAMLVDLQDDVVTNPNEWLVVVDMQMPMYHGAPVSTEAGFRLLREMTCMALTCPAVIVSSKAVDNAKALKFYSSYRGSIMFHPLTMTSTDFKNLINDCL